MPSSSSATRKAWGRGSQQLHQRVEGRVQGQESPSEPRRVWPQGASSARPQFTQPQRTEGARSRSQWAPSEGQPRPGGHPPGACCTPEGRGLAPAFRASATVDGARFAAGSCAGWGGRDSRPGGGGGRGQDPPPPLAGLSGRGRGSGADTVPPQDPLGALASQSHLWILLCHGPEGEDGHRPPSAPHQKEGGPRSWDSHGSSWGAGVTGSDQLWSSAARPGCSTPLGARRAPLEHELGGWAGASGTWAGGGASSFGAGAGTHQFVVVINVLLPESTEVSGRQTHRCPTELGVQAGGASEVILTSGATTPWPFRG